MRTLGLALTLSALLVGCGPPSTMDAGVDAGRDASVVVPPVDAGVDAGMMEVDAGPPPPRTVFGSVTINGTTRELWTGYGTGNMTTTQLRLGTRDSEQPRFLITLVLPPMPGNAYTDTCSSMTAVPFLSAQQIEDAGVAFFTRNDVCTVALTQEATMADEDYIGTFSGTVDYEPRSVLDAGYRQLVLTNGSFTVRRSFWASSLRDGSPPARVTNGSFGVRGSF